MLLYSVTLSYIMLHYITLHCSLPEASTYEMFDKGSPKPMSTTMGFATLLRKPPCYCYCCYCYYCYYYYYYYYYY